jgi:2'-5' RNA ligase
MGTSTDSEQDAMSAVPRSQPIYRYFFALMPDEVTARRIHAFAEGQFGEKGIMRTDRLHVTLAITADFNAAYPALAEALCRAGDAVAAAPFDLLLEQLSRARETAALRPAHGLPPLRALQDSIARAMAAQGVPMRPDWRFNPHVTLMYRKGDPMLPRPVENFGWAVREFVLVESLVGLTRHNVIGRWTLSTPQPSLFPD